MTAHELDADGNCGDCAVAAQAINRRNDGHEAENAKLRRELEYADDLHAESKELADSEFRLLEAENAKLRAENHEARKMALTQASDDELWGQPVEQTRWELRRLIQAVLRPLAPAEAEEQSHE